MVQPDVEDADRVPRFIDRSMIYRRFGRTGLRMPVLSAGFMRAMHSWQPFPAREIPPGSQGNFDRIVQQALALGINHFETARGYGTSEQQLGTALRRVGDRDSYLLQTKIRPADAPEAFIADFHDSLGRLGVDRVDLLAVHGINDYRSLWQTCRPNGCLAAARELQRKGLAGWIGFSGHGTPKVVLAALRHSGDGGFDYVNLHWYYIWQVNAPALEEAARQDMGVFIISPTDKGGMLHNPPARFIELCRPCPPMVFNDLYCLERPEVHTISIGAARPEDFASHVAALDLLGRSRSLLRDIDLRCRGEMAKVTGSPRPEALWAKLPPWHSTPGYINIPFILWLANLVRGWGLEEFARRRYGQLGRDVYWVPGNNGGDAGRYDLGAIAGRAGLETAELGRLLAEAHAMLSGPEL